MCKCVVACMKGWGWRGEEHGGGVKGGVCVIGWGGGGREEGGVPSVTSHERGPRRRHGTGGHHTGFRCLQMRKTTKTQRTVVSVPRLRRGGRAGPRPQHSVGNRWFSNWRLPAKTRQMERRFTMKAALAPGSDAVSTHWVPSPRPWLLIRVLGTPLCRHPRVHPCDNEIECK
jgi:hypothetical protein